MSVLPARCQGWQTGQHLTASPRPAASSAESDVRWTGPVAAVPAAELQTLAPLRALHPVTQNCTLSQSSALVHLCLCADQHAGHPEANGTHDINLMPCVSCLCLPPSQNPPLLPPCWRQSRNESWCTSFSQGFASTTRLNFCLSLSMLWSG